MSINDFGGMIPTTELIRRAAITRAVLARLRSSYPELTPTMTLPPHNLYWPSTAVEQVLRLLQTEEERRLGRFVL